LVIGMNYIGDTLFTTPLIRALAKFWPDARIDVLNGARGAPMLANHPAVSEVLIRPSREATRETQTALMARLRAGRYDCAIVTPTSFESAWIALRAGIPVRSGIHAECRGPLLTHAWHSAHRHIIRRMLDALLPLGVPSDGVQMEIFLTQSEEAQALDLLSTKGLAPGSYLVVHPGANRLTKRWATSHFAECLRLFHQAVGAPVVLVGGSADAERNRSIAAACGPGVALDCTNTFDLRILAGLLKHARAFLGNDSAPLHIASAMNVRSVGLFGQSDPAIYGTLHTGGIVLDSRSSCPPLRRSFCPIKSFCPPVSCMDSITPQEVSRALQTICSEGQPAPVRVAAGDPR
jgi:heptosyltransferase-2